MINKIDLYLLHGVFSGQNKTWKDLVQELAKDKDYMKLAVAKKQFCKIYTQL